MGAIAGVLGSAAQDPAAAMLERLGHRGRRRHTLPVAGGGFLAVVADEPDTNLRDLGERALACDASTSAARALGRVAEPGALEAVAGNFALAWLDRGARRVLLARDFFGTRPLYYVGLPGGGLAFASEYKALLCLSGVGTRPDLDMLQYLQHAKKLPVDRTLLEDVRAVPAGCVLEVDFEGRARERHRFAPLAVEVDALAESEAAERVRHELREAVRRQCGEGERIGIALSGGIDSIGVACLVRELFPERELHTYTASNGPEDPEGITGRRVAEGLGATHCDVVTPPDLLETRLERLIWHLEDPFARSETLQLFEVGAAAAGRVDVLLSGQGADSLFGGMPRYRMLDWMRPLLGVPGLRRPLTEFYNRTQLGLAPQSWPGRALDLAYYRGNLPPVPRVIGARGGPEPAELPEAGPEFVNRAMARGFQSGQAADFPKYERCFAAFGLAYRSPFCDPAFARSAYRVSDAWKIHRGKQKYILRRAMESVVPDNFLQVPKFMQALQHDRAFADRLDAVCARVLSREALERRGWFDPDEIARLCQRPAGGAYGRDAANRIWTVLATELWGQLFLDRRGAPPE